MATRDPEPGPEPRRTTTDGEVDLIEPEGVNAGSALGERDREPSGDVAVRPAAAADPEVPPDELVGAPGQRPDVPGQQLGAGEG